MATEWYLAKKEELTEIAIAIRNLNGGNAGLKLNDMKNAINTEKSNLEAVKTALKGKGVTVADGAVLSDLSGLIDEIDQGDFLIEHGTRTFIEDVYPKSTPVVIEHSLGVVPFLFVGVAGAGAQYPQYEIAYVIKAKEIQGYTYPLRSYYSFLAYAKNAGSYDLILDASSNIVVLSDTSITINSSKAGAGFFASTYTDFSPCTLNWYAIALK